MKSLMLLWKILAQECASGCHTSATMDWKTVQGRCKHEGLSFLTITLPNFGKDTQKCLDQGYVDRNLFQGFSWKGGLPKFLWGFLDLVFDRTSGVLLDNPDIEAIRSIRQLTLMFGKMLLPCSPAREEAAYAAYIECEQDVRASYERLTDTDKYQFRQMAGTLFGSVFTDIDRQIYEGELLPKHGPGATAEKLTSNGKYRLKTWPARLERYFPCGEYLIPNFRHWQELENVDILEPGDEIPVRVISVPKTLKTPRIIGIEPASMQYMQQAILHLITEGLHKCDYLWDFIGYKDQTPNQCLALEGSRNGNLATLDLSEASDRVSNQHVRLLLENHPHFHEGVQATRSRKADVPGHGVQRLAKFASMGSALCFPMESMVFLTVVFLGIQRSLNTSLSLKDIKSFKGSVRIFGDDIIIPVDHVESVVAALQTFGFVVNRGKSFWTGKFRESCGKDYYDGDDVSVVKVRRMPPTLLQHATEVNSLVELRNQLYTAGYWKTASYLDGRLEKMLKHYPRVSPSSSVLGRHSFLGYETQRIDEHTHSPLVKGYVLSAKSPRDPLDGVAALHKCLLRSTWQEEVSRGSQSRLSHLDPPVAEPHLERAGRPHAVGIKLRWSPPF